MSTLTQMKQTKVYKKRTVYTYLNNHDIKFAMVLNRLYQRGKVVFVVSKLGVLQHVVYLPDDRGLMNVEGEAKVFDGWGVKNLSYAETAPYYPTDLEVENELRRRGLAFEKGEEESIRKYIMEVWNKQVGLI